MLTRSIWRLYRKMKCFYELLSQRKNCRRFSEKLRSQMGRYGPRNYCIGNVQQKGSPVGPKRVSGWSKKGSPGGPKRVSGLSNKKSLRLVQKGFPVGPIKGLRLVQKRVSGWSKKGLWLVQKVTKLLKMTSKFSLEYNIV